MIKQNINKTFKAKQKQNIMPCEQKMCGFRKSGCKTCESCGTKPHYVAEKCETCWNCEFKEGRLRWGNQEQKEEIKVAKPHEQEIMVVAR